MTDSTAEPYETVILRSLSNLVLIIGFYNPSFFTYDPETLVNILILFQDDIL